MVSQGVRTLKEDYEIHPLRDMLLRRERGGRVYSNPGIEALFAAFTETESNLISLHVVAISKVGIVR